MSSLQRTPPRAGQPVVNNTSSQSHKRRAGEQGWAAEDETPEKLSLEAAVKMLVTEFNKTNTKIDEMNGKIDGVKRELTTVRNEIATLKGECAEKFKATDIALLSVNQKVDHLDQALGTVENRSELTIRGIPYISGENLSTYFNAICQQLGVRVPSTHIRRVTPRSKPANDNGLIVVEFSLKNDREDFYSAYLRKHDLRLRHVGLDSDHRIYVNENLTIAARKLKVLALNLKRAGKLSTVFTKQGVVHVKKAAEDSSVAIHREEDLSCFS